MRTMVVRPETYKAIADAATLPFHSTATKRLDGNWDVPVSEETYEKIKGIQYSNETDDDTIARILHFHCGGKLS